MRHTIGGTWILGIALVFILFFCGFIILTLNYSRTVRVKNEMIDMVEKYEGINRESITLLNNYLYYAGYDVSGVCVNEGEDEIGVYGATSLSNSTLEPAREGTKYFYCIKKYDGANTSNYYQIIIFYKFNLPIVGETSGFTIKGTTSNFQSHDENSYSDSIGD